KVAFRGLVLLGHHNLALGFGALDLLSAAERSALLRGRGSLGALLLGWRGGLGLIRDHEALALKDSVALRELDLAEEGRLLALVAHLQRIRFNPHRLIAIELQALHRAARLILLRGLCRSRHRSRKRKREPGERDSQPPECAHCDA